MRAITSASRRSRPGPASSSAPPTVCSPAWPIATSQAESHGHYSLGFKVLELAGSVQAHRRPCRARPHLKYPQATSETTNLVILDRDRVVYVDQVPGLHNVKDVHPGWKLALAHTTASRKAILAHRPADAISELYPGEREPLERLTPHTQTTVESLREDFVRIRAARLRNRQRGARGRRQLRGGSGLRRRRRVRRHQHLRSHDPDRPRLHVGTFGHLLGRHASELSSALGDAPVAERPAAG